MNEAKNTATTEVWEVLLDQSTEGSMHGLSQPTFIGTSIDKSESKADLIPEKKMLLRAL